MATQKLTGKQLAQMLLGGAALLSGHTDEVNALNVFPVPDGDTGTNMMKTLSGGLSELAEYDGDSAHAVLELFSRGAMLGASGNSGVILSRFFAGMSDALTDEEWINADSLAAMFKNGVKWAYLSVEKPTEGTILTVFRESADYAAANISPDSSIEDYFTLNIRKAKETLAATKQMLPQLAEADVIDSGGAGYLYILMGMLKALSGEIDESFTVNYSDRVQKTDFSSFTRDSVLEYGYCTEVFLRLMTAKTDPDSFDVKTITDELTALGGESIVAYTVGDAVKVHVHTFNPGQILGVLQAYGEFLSVKIENMSLTHSGEAAPSQKKKKIATVAVATGEGMTALFTELGADAIISGGQTDNPSTKDFIDAFSALRAENIIVLPNNKNIFLAAKQAAELYNEAKIRIIPTESLMQGYSALSVLTTGIDDVDSLVESLTRAAKSVVGAQVTRAVRDAAVGGVLVRRGEYMAILDGEISAVAPDAQTAVVKMLESLDMDEYELITLFVGEGVGDNERVELTELIENSYPDVECTVYIGGQAVYDYLIAVE